MFKILPNTKEILKELPKTFKILQKVAATFAKSGHTGSGKHLFKGMRGELKWLSTKFDAA